MKKLFIDYETVSDVDIKKSLHEYTNSPQFKIILISFAFNNDPVTTIDLTTESVPAYLLNALNDSTIIKYAFNAYFEILCTSNHFNIPLNFDFIKQWRCVAYLTDSYGLSGGLANVCNILNLSDESKKEGKHLISLFSTVDYLENIKNHKEEYEEYKIYSKYDIVSIQNLVNLIERNNYISSLEWENYYSIILMNTKGVGVDLDLAIKLKDIYSKSKPYFKTLIETEYGIKNASVHKIKAYYKDTYNITFDSLSKANYEKNISNLTDDQKKLLTYTKYLTSTSGAKFDKITFKQYQSVVYGEFRPLGSITGRCSSSGVQLQNLSKSLVKNDEAFIDEILNYSYENLLEKYDHNLFEYVGSLTRCCFVPKNKKFIICDYSSIEPRIASVITNCNGLKELFNSDKDVYLQFAKLLFNKDIEQITKLERSISKEIVLGCNYGMGVSKFKSSLKSKGIDLDEDTIKSYIDFYKRTYPEIFSFYKDIENGVNILLNNYITFYAVNDFISLKKVGKDIQIILPSRRKILLKDPKIELGTYGTEILYKKYNNPKSDSFVYNKIWGGNFLEWLCQGIASDIILEAQNRFSKFNFNVVMQIHDELVIEAEEKDISIIESIMSYPVWFMPEIKLKISTTVSERYTK